MGSASASDAVDMVAAADDGRGIVAAIRRALKRAGLHPGQLTYITAPRPRTPPRDRARPHAPQQKRP